MRSADDERVREADHPLDLPDDPETDAGEQHAHSRRSLTDDMLALLDDGKTYAQAEMRYQKSRAGFVANQAKGATVFGAAAFGVLHLALIALTVGVVIALTPIVGPWLATGIVVIVLLIAGVVFLRLLKGKLDEIRDAFSEGPQ